MKTEHLGCFQKFHLCFQVHDAETMVCQVIVVSVFLLQQTSWHNNGHVVLTSTSFSLLKKKQFNFKWFIFKLFKVFASKNLKHQVAVMRSGITGD